MERLPYSWRAAAEFTLGRDGRDNAAVAQAFRDVNRGIDYRRSSIVARCPCDRASLPSQVSSGASNASANAT